MATNIHDPLSVGIPYQFHSQDDFPTEIVAHRFQAWRYILKDLIAYLKSYASVQEEILRQQARLQQAVGASAAVASSSASITKNSHAKDKERHEDIQAINQFFLPIGNGSIQDLPTILTRFHQQNIENGTKTLKEIQSSVIPRLEELRKDLVLKIKEIRKLQNDFKNTIARDLQDSSSLLSKFYHAIDYANRHEMLTTDPMNHIHDSHNESESNKRDPYLAKVKLKEQLSRQLKEERYLYDAYENLQTSSQKLENIVVMELQSCFTMFLNLVQNEHSSIPDFLVPRLTEGFLAKEPSFEWNSFIDRNLPKTSSISKNISSGKFIDLAFPPRKLADLNIPHFDSLVNIPIREGTLERRSKFLNKYSSGWYVLTCSYLHQFKITNKKREPDPVMSLALDTCSVDKHTKKDDSKQFGSYKFILYSKQQNGLIHRGHNWSFKCDSYEEMISWYNDIKELTSLASPSLRAKAFSKVLQAKNDTNDKKLSRTSSVLTTQTTRAAQSVRTNVTDASKALHALSPSQSVRSTALSQVMSTASTGQNKRLSSTFSQKNYRQSPKLSNLINSDGTIVTPVETQKDDDFKEPEHGDTTLTGHSSVHGQDPNGEVTSQTHDAQGSVHLQNGAFSTHQSTPQQFIPQNYQYYVSQVNSQPQQFYDPVSQQFFTVNAIPVPDASQVASVASQVPTASTQQSQANRSQAPGQPMPQYFPSSPQPQPSVQYFPTSPSFQPQIIHTAATPQNGQSSEGKRAAQAAYVPHFPQHFNEQGGQGAQTPNGQQAGSSLPYPVNLEHPTQSRQNSTTSVGSFTLAKTVPGTFSTVEENSKGEIVETKV